MDAGSRLGGFEHRLEEILALGMLDCTGNLALLAANASLGIDKHGFHTSYLIVGSRDDGCEAPVRPPAGANRAGRAEGSAGDHFLSIIDVDAKPGKKAVVDCSLHHSSRQRDELHL